MDFNEIAVFVRVVKAGGFSRAARELGMPNSTVSAKVSALEKRLGVTLLTRTTRKLSLTEPGEAYFRRCVQGLAEIELAENALAECQAEPSGTLRVTAPVELGSAVLPLIAEEFRRQYPKVGLEFLLGDRMVDLVAENVDLAIRAGDLKDSSLIAKKLGTVSFGLFASADYLKKHGRPAHPRELREHTCLQFSPLEGGAWELHGPKGKVRATITTPLLANDLNFLKALAIAGSGIALLPTFLCTSEDGLKRVLPDWRSDTRPVHFVYPAQKFVPAKLSAFVALATPLLQRSLSARGDGT